MHGIGKPWQWYAPQTKMLFMCQAQKWDTEAPSARITTTNKHQTDLMEKHWWATLLHFPRRVEHFFFKNFRILRHLSVICLSIFIMKSFVILVWLLSTCKGNLLGGKITATKWISVLELLSVCSPSIFSINCPKVDILMFVVPSGMAESMAND